MKSARKNSRGPRRYVWIHTADWDRDSWNGISYTGNEPGMIRMRFHAMRPFNRRRESWAKKITIKTLVRYTRGRKRRQLLIIMAKGMR